MKAIVVAGTCNGVGKTSIAVGLMAAYTRRGLKVQPFKIGPDFVDLLHHKAATGRESFSLDSWMLSRNGNMHSFGRNRSYADLAIVEGAMGLYDGYNGKTEEGSTAEIAKLLSAPVLLVIDCKSLARSVAAVIQGYVTFDRGVKFAGVLFNKVSGPSHTAELSEAVSSLDFKVRVFGGIPALEEFRSPTGEFLSGTGGEEEHDELIQKLADLVELHIDLDGLLEESLTYPDEDEDSTIEDTTLYANMFHKPVRIGVARDSAFCLYYQENLALLQDAGAEIVYFSPLKDLLPPMLDAIYFGGGFLEPYLDQLSANKQLLYSIKAFADAGGVVYGESGGVTYLSQGVKGVEMESYPMCGIFPFWSRLVKTIKTKYVKVIPREDCVLFRAELGEIHGLMYSSSEIVWADEGRADKCPRGFFLKDDRGMKGAGGLEGFIQGNAMTSSVHLHFGSNSDIAFDFVQRCRMERTKAAAVAAASASAVAEAGPAAAAAAGAAAAAAVTAAAVDDDDGCREIVPFYKKERVAHGPNCNSKDPKWNDDRFFQYPRQGDSWATSDAGTFSPSRDSFGTHSSATSSMPRSESFDLDRLRRAGNTNGRMERTMWLESDKWDGMSEWRSSSEVASSLRKSGSVGAFSDGMGLVKKERNGFSIVEALSSKLRNRPPLAGKQGHHLETSLEVERPLMLNLWQPSLGHGCELQMTRSRLPSFRCGERGVFPEKIVSLLPSVTEILIELGVGRRLIAITDSCNRPPGVQSGRHIVGRSRIDLASVPNRTMESTGEWKPYLGSLRNGGKLKVDTSWLSKAKPDLVVTEERESHAGSLAQAGLYSGNILVVNPRTLSEVMDAILNLGHAVGLFKEACLLVDFLRARFRKVVASVSLQSRPRLLLLQGLDPLLIGGHWVPEIELLAGAFDGLQKPGCGVEMLHWHRIISYAPEVIVLAPCSLSIEETLSKDCSSGACERNWSSYSLIHTKIRNRLKTTQLEKLVYCRANLRLLRKLKTLAGPMQVELLARLRGFWHIPAVEAGRVYICDHTCFSTSGLRLVNGVELLACILHPLSMASIPLPEMALKLNLNYGQQCSPQDLPKHFKPFL